MTQLPGEESRRLLGELSPNGTREDWVEVYKITLEGVELIELCQNRDGTDGRSIYLTPANIAELIPLLSSNRPAPRFGEPSYFIGALSPNGQREDFLIEVRLTRQGTDARTELQQRSGSNGRRSIYLTKVNRTELRHILEKVTA
jgi:hypothetical protein